MTTQPLRTRLTRQQAQAETRARLLDAALALIAEEGVGAASIRGICERAGYSQGAFYSNFVSKQDLLLALVAGRLTGIAQGLVDLIAETSELDVAGTLTALSARLGAASESPVLSRLVIELSLHAQRNAAFAAQFAVFTDGFRADVTRVVDALVTRHALIPRQPPARIGETLLALWFGTLVQSGNPDRKAAISLQADYLRAVL